MAKKEALPAFDESKLAELSEPITVTVHRIEGGRPSPIELPVKPGEPGSGLGWTQDEVRGLDGFLGKKYAADGGLFYSTATGQNGAQMRWQAWFRPERPQVAQPAQSTPLSGAAPQSASGNGLVAGPAQWLQTAVPPTVSVFPPVPPAMPAYMQPSPGEPSVQAMLRARDEEVLKEREARIQLEARIDRERLEGHYKEQLGILSQELRRVQEAVNARPQESDESRALKAELDSLRKERENDRMMAVIREVQSSTQQQIAALTQMVQQIAQQAAQPKSDPMIMLLIEQTKAQTEAQRAQAAAQTEAARLAAEAQKEIARLQAESSREAARNAIGPREMLEMAAKMSTGPEQIARAYTGVVELTQRAIESTLQMQGPQTHPALEMVQQGMQGALGVMERYISAKESASSNQARAAAAVAQAQAQAAMAQRAGLAAPAGAVDVEGKEGDNDDEEGDEDAPSPEEVNAAERELFGPALDAVRRLRSGAASGAVTPEQAASALLQGIDHFGKRGDGIPAFDLWRKGELGVLTDVLLPDAPTSYREQMASALYAAKQARAA